MRSDWVEWLKADWRWLKAAAVIVGLAVTGVFAYFVLVVATATPPNKTAAALLQIVTLFIGIAASFAVGRFSAQRAASELIKPHARSAFRRSLSIFKGFERTIAALDQTEHELAEQVGDDGCVDLRLVRYALRAIRLQVAEQVGIAGDAMEDWRDVVPEEIEAVERRLREAQAGPPNASEDGEA